MHALIDRYEELAFLICVLTSAKTRLRNIYLIKKHVFSERYADIIWWHLSVLSKKREIISEWWFKIWRSGQYVKLLFWLGLFRNECQNKSWLKTHGARPPNVTSCRDSSLTGGTWPTPGPETNKLCKKMSSLATRSQLWPQLVYHLYQRGVHTRRVELFACSWPRGLQLHPLDQSHLYMGLLLLLRCQALLLHQVKSWNGLFLKKKKIVFKKTYGLL